MNTKKEILKFDNINGNKLGIKVFIAKDTETDKTFSIIADVNPAGYCFSKSISPGDILLSINAKDINACGNFNDIINHNSPINQITVMKSGILDGSDLFKRCVSSPCSKLCELWNDNSMKFPIQNTIVDKQSSALSDPVIILKPSKQSTIEETNVKDTSQVNKQGQISTGKLFVSNNPKIKFHHKISHNSKIASGLNETSSTKVVNRTGKPLSKDLLTGRLPRFVKHEDSRFYNTNFSNNVKQAKSLDNLTDITDNCLMSNDTSPSFKFKSDLFSNSIIHSIEKPNILPRRRSLEIIESSSLKPLHDNNISHVENIQLTVNKLKFNFQEFEQVYRRISQSKLPIA